ncbi:hypothetical protein LTR85_011291 [Meristemomyces frigidus]|nr:hypothetical protein LTR85_011291 [Meristemomyces frigidus]
MPTLDDGIAHHGGHTQALHGAHGQSRRASKQDDNARFPYPQLDDSKREIRLMRLLASDGHIAGRVATFSLESPPEYTALSYRCGIEDVGHRIELNGCEYVVRPELYAYLRAMRREDNRSWFFIDAICINQWDNAEKSGQVMLMGEIYRKARRVTAWLGHSDAYSHPNSRAALKAAPTGLTDPRVLADADIARKLVDVVYWCVGRSEYWSRLWIVQETILARSLVIRLGPFNIGWRVLRAVLDSDPRKFRDGTGMHGIHRGSNSTAPGDIWRSIMMGTIVQAKGQAGRHRFTLLAGALELFANQDCADPRDKMFGIRALVHTCIQADYTMQLSELYVRALVEARTQLGMLQAIRSDLLQQKGRIGGIEQCFRRKYLPDFYLAFTQAFDWPLHDLTLGLIFQTATGDLRDFHRIWPVIDEPFEGWSVARVIIGNVRINTRRGAGYLRYHHLRARLRRCKAKGSFMTMPGDATDGRSYQGWVKFAMAIAADMRREMSRDRYIGDFLLRVIDSPDENLMRKLKAHITECDVRCRTRSFYSKPETAACRIPLPADFSR